MQDDGTCQAAGGEDSCPLTVGTLESDRPGQPPARNGRSDRGRLCRAGHPLPTGPGRMRSGQGRAQTTARGPASGALGPRYGRASSARWGGASLPSVPGALRQLMAPYGAEDAPWRARSWSIEPGCRGRVLGSVVAS